LRHGLFPFFLFLVCAFLVSISTPFVLHVSSISRTHSSSLGSTTSLSEKLNRRGWLGKAAYGALIPAISVGSGNAVAEDASIAAISDDLAMPEVSLVSEADEKKLIAERLAKKAALQKKSSRPLDYGQSIKVEKEKQADMKKIYLFLLPTLFHFLRPSAAFAATMSSDLGLKDAMFPLIVSASSGLVLSMLADLLVQISGNDISNDSEMYRCSYLMSMTKVSLVTKWKNFVGRLKDRGRAINLARLASFALFGLFLKGIFQFFLYSFWIPKFTQRGGLALGVLVDQGFYVPGMYYPVYFVLTGKIQYNRSFMDSLGAYKKDAVKLITASTLFWIPIQIFNFTYTPEVWRNLVVLLSAFGWTILLSILTQ